MTFKDLPFEEKQSAPSAAVQNTAEARLAALEAEANQQRETAEVQQPTSVFIREIAETALLTLLIFWLVHSATGRFRIEGQSMEPTLHELQYVLINKLSYVFSEPQRGDIIVLQFPGDPNRERDFIKRVIGVPGDRIQVNDGQVLINGAVLDEPYINGPPSYSVDTVVPEGSYYVLGDNRNNSHDSHSWAVPETGAFLPREDIIGKAWFIYWKPNEWGLVPHYPHPEVMTVSETE